MLKLNTLPNTINTQISKLQEQLAKLSIPPALTMQASKTMLAASSLFHFVGASVSRLICVASNNKFLNEKATELFAKAGADYNKAGTAGLAGFALCLVALATFYLNRTKSPSEPCEFIPGDSQHRAITIPQGSMNTLNQLLQKSPYKSVAKVPVYTGPKAADIRPENMKNPIEKGVFSWSKGEQNYERPFIAIKIKTDFSKCTRMNNYEDEAQAIFKTMTNHEDVIILIQASPNVVNAQPVKPQFSWRQLYRGDICSPSIFNPWFNSVKDGSLLDDAKEEFEALQKLIGGEGLIKELHGLTWRLTN